MHRRARTCRSVSARSCSFQAKGSVRGTRGLSVIVIRSLGSVASSGYFNLDLASLRIPEGKSVTQRTKCLVFVTPE